VNLTVPQRGGAQIDERKPDVVGVSGVVSRRRRWSRTRRSCRSLMSSPTSRARSSQTGQSTSLAHGHWGGDFPV